jgi:hypothetical protein
MVLYNFPTLRSCTWSLMLSLPACSPRLQAPFLPARHPLLPRPPPHFAPLDQWPLLPLEVQVSLCGGIFACALQLQL